MDANKKLPYIVGGAAILLILGLMFFLGQANKQTQSASNLNPATNSAQSSSQDPQDIVPGLYTNPIQNNSTSEGFVIAAATVENNIDSTGRTVNDHLELKLQNTSGKNLTDFEVYYTITDTVTNKKEGYYKKLTGFILKAGQAQSINFDNLQGEGHFTANKNSVYYTSSNKLNFEVMVSTAGYKVQNIKVTKAAGGAETKD